MDIAKKYEDVVAERDSALAREAALRDELNCPFRIEHHSKRLIEGLKQRLTVAEQRVGELEGLLREVANLDPRGEFLGWQLDGKIESALKPAAEPHKCIECDSQYCHGVCVERGDDDERYKGVEGEGA